MDWYYDRNGFPKLFIYNNRLISKNGENLCWIVNSYLYSLKTGKHIGWIENDIIYDINNKILAFSYNASNLPYRPGLHGVPGLPGIPGVPGMPELSGVYGRPGFGGFSSEEVLEYFYNRK